MRLNVPRECNAWTLIYTWELTHPGECTQSWPIRTATAVIETNHPGLTPPPTTTMTPLPGRHNHHYHRIEMS